MFNQPNVEVAGVVLNPSMSSHYSNLFDTFLNTEKEKLESMKPQLIKKYEGSRDWEPNIFNDREMTHPILGVKPYELVKKRRYQLPDEYSISAGDFNESYSSPSERYGRTLEKFEVEQALEEVTPFAEEILDRIASFYEPALPAPREEGYLYDDDEYY